MTLVGLATVARDAQRQVHADAGRALGALRAALGSRASDGMASVPSAVALLTEAAAMARTTASLLEQGVRDARDTDGAPLAALGDAIERGRQAARPRGLLQLEESLG